MKPHRFIGQFNLDKPELKIHDKELVNQIRNVLRLKTGEEVVLSEGNLNEGRAEITELGKDFVIFEIKEKWQNQNEPERKTVLYCAILKRENFELVAQKATEAGIKEIVPVLSQRTIKLDIRKERLEKIIREAAEQSGRGIVPVLHDAVSFEKAIQDVDKSGVNLLFDVSCKKLDFYTIDHTLPISIWIGPEGGWTPDEIELAKSRNFNITSLGKLTLRAETAAIVASYLAIHNL